MKGNKQCEIEDIISHLEDALYQWDNEEGHHRSYDELDDLFTKDLEDLKETLSAYLPNDFTWPNKIENWTEGIYKHIAMEYDNFLVVCEVEFIDSHINVYEARYLEPRVITIPTVCKLS
jgi:hypothetical protein